MRFPRAAWVRRLEQLQRDAWDWKNDLTFHANTAQSAYLEGKLSDRAAEFDDLWHLLDSVIVFLDGMR